VGGASAGASVAPVRRRGLAHGLQAGLASSQLGEARRDVSDTTVLGRDENSRRANLHDAESRRLSQLQHLAFACGQQAAPGVGQACSRGAPWVNVPRPELAQVAGPRHAAVRPRFRRASSSVSHACRSGASTSAASSRGTRPGLGAAQRSARQFARGMPRSPEICSRVGRGPRRSSEGPPTPALPHPEGELRRRARVNASATPAGRLPRPRSVRAVSSPESHAAFRPGRGAPVPRGGTPSLARPGASASSRASATRGLRFRARTRPSTHQRHHPRYDGHQLGAAEQAIGELRGGRRS
jgi:hypothetical protein